MFGASTGGGVASGRWGLGSRLGATLKERGGPSGKAGLGIEFAS